MGVTYAFLSALGFSLMFILTRKGLVEDTAKTSVWFINLISVIGALILFSIVLLFSSGNIFDELLALSKVATIMLIIDGLMGCMIGMLLGILAIAKLGASHASAIRGGANPFFATLLSVLFLGEQPGLTGYLGVSIIIIGIIIVGLQNASQSMELKKNSLLSGGTYAILSGLAFAISNTARGVAIKYGATINAGYMVTLITSLAILAIYCLMSGNFSHTLKNINPKGFFYYLGSGGGLFVGVYCLLISFTMIPVWQAVSIRNTQPIIVLVIMYILNRKTEMLTNRLIIGAITVTFGAILLNLK